MGEEVKKYTAVFRFDGGEFVTSSDEINTAKESKPPLGIEWISAVEGDTSEDDLSKIYGEDEQETKDGGEKMNILEFMNESARLCNSMERCAECPLLGHCVFDKDAAADNARVKKVIEIVEKWSKEHPRKTRWQLLCEQYPSIEESIKKCLCCRKFGYNCPMCGTIDCEQCWNLPIEEKEQE